MNAKQQPCHKANHSYTVFPFCISIRISEKQVASGATNSVILLQKLPPVFLPLLLIKLIIKLLSTADSMFAVHS